MGVLPRKVERRLKRAFRVAWEAHSLLQVYRAVNEGRCLLSRKPLTHQAFAEEATGAVLDPDFAKAFGEFLRLVLEL